MCCVLFCFVFVRLISHEMVCAFNALSRTHTYIQLYVQIHKYKRTYTHPKQPSKNDGTKVPTKTNLYEKFCAQEHHVNLTRLRKECTKCVYYCECVVYVLLWVSFYIFNSTQNYSISQRALSLKQLNKSTTSINKTECQRKRCHHQHKKKRDRSSVLSFKIHTTSTPYSELLSGCMATWTLNMASWNEMNQIK